MKSLTTMSGSPGLSLWGGNERNSTGHDAVSHFEKKSESHFHLCYFVFCRTKRRKMADKVLPQRVGVLSVPFFTPHEQGFLCCD